MFLMPAVKLTEAVKKVAVLVLGAVWEEKKRERESTLLLPGPLGKNKETSAHIH